MGVSVSGNGMGEKSAPGSGMYMDYTADQRTVYYLVLSGTTSANCLWEPQTAPWTFTLANNGVTYVAFQQTYWENSKLNPAGGYYCGIERTYTTGDAMLAPGNWVATLAWPQYGSPMTLSLPVPACSNAATNTTYLTRNDEVTNNFYTTLYADRQSSINDYGYSARPNPFRTVHGSSVGAPWKRYFKGAPQIEHFYTHLADEQSMVVNTLGYVYEKDEGYVYTASNITGTVPLTRLTKFNDSNGDLQHVYVTTAGEVSSYQSQGWTSDGVKGYVCPP